MSAEEIKSDPVERVPKAHSLRGAIFVSIYDNLRTAYWECGGLRMLFKQRASLRRLAHVIERDRDEELVGEFKSSILEIVGVLESIGMLGETAHLSPVHGQPRSRVPCVESPRLRSRKSVFFEDSTLPIHDLGRLPKLMLDKITWSFPENVVNLRRSALLELQVYLDDLSLTLRQSRQYGEEFRPKAFSQTLSNYFKAAANQRNSKCAFSEGLRLSIWCYRLIDAAIEAIDHSTESRPPAKPTRNYATNMKRAERMLMTRPELRKASVTEFRKAVGGNSEDAGTIYSELMERGDITPPISRKNRRDG